MVNLFFSGPADLETASHLVFRVLGASPIVGSSANVAGGTYTMLSVLGFKVKLELNSYDYEAQYAYMLSVGADYLTDIVIDEVLEQAMASLVARLLSKNLSLAIALERVDGLEYYPAC